MKCVLKALYKERTGIPWQSFKVLRQSRQNYETLLERENEICNHSNGKENFRFHSIYMSSHRTYSTYWIGHCGFVFTSGGQSFKLKPKI